MWLYVVASLIVCLTLLPSGFKFSQLEMSTYPLRPPTTDALVLTHITSRRGRPGSPPTTLQVHARAQGHRVEQRGRDVPRRRPGLDDAVAPDGRRGAASVELTT